MKTYMKIEGGRCWARDLLTNRIEGMVRKREKEYGPRKKTWIGK